MKLIDAWCDQRNLGALRQLLPHFPMPNGFTDELVQLQNALKTIRYQYSETVKPDDMERLIVALHQVESMLSRK
jgi:hypothetical protein